VGQQESDRQEILDLLDLLDLLEILVGANEDLRYPQRSCLPCSLPLGETGLLLLRLPASSPCSRASLWGVAVQWRGPRSARLSAGPGMAQLPSPLPFPGEHTALGYVQGHTCL